MNEQNKARLSFQTVREVLEAYAADPDPAGAPGEWADELVASFRRRLFGTVAPDVGPGLRVWDQRATE